MNDVFGLGQSSIAPLVLDRLPATAGSWSFGRRKRRGWLGPVGTLYRTSDGVEIPVFGQGRWGLVGTRFVRAFNGWNLFARSEEFDHAAWGSVGWNVVPNSAVAPDGTMTADLVSADTNNNAHNGFQNITWRAGQTYTMSVYAKYLSHQFLTMRTGGAAGDRRFATFDLSSMSVASVSAGGIASVGPDVGDGWRRLSFTNSIGTTNTLGAILALNNANDLNIDAYVGAGTGCFLWGAQLVVGASADVYERREATGAGNVLWSRSFDQSGNGRHFEQANADLMPYACRQGVPVTENGVLAAEFVATELRRMQVPNSAGMFNFIHSGKATIAGVKRWNATTSIKAILSNQTTTDSASGFQLSDNGSTEGFLVRVGNGTSAVIDAAKNTPSTANRVFTTRIDTTNAVAALREETRLNGTVASGSNVETNAAVSGNASTVLNLGARGGSRYHDGTISDVDIWEGELTSAQIQLYERDASRHYGMAIA